MAKTVNDIYQSLQKLVGLHRQLMDTVRLERDALVDANLKSIQEITVAKQGLIEAIRQAEVERIKATGTLAMMLKRPVRDLTLPAIIIEVQGSDLKLAEQLRSSFNALTILIQRITDMNRDNQSLVERSLEHINAMKKNAIDEAAPKHNTYTQNGTRTTSGSSSRLLSQEA